MKYSNYERQNASPAYTQSAAIPVPCSGCGSKMMPQNSLPMGKMQPALPTGVPTGPATAPTIGTEPMAQMQGVVPSTGVQPPLTTQNIMFTQGFLSTQIGKLMRVEFLIGTNGPLVDRVGTLIGVGTSYILIRPTGTDDVLLCDMYSIKFVTIMF